MNPANRPDSWLKYYPDVQSKRRRILEILKTKETPLFLCDRQNLVDRYGDLRRSLGLRWGPCVIGYSFKTNYLVARSGIFHELGAWAEVVSGYEYGMARRLGFPGTHIIFNGPHKPDAVLKAAIAEGSLVNVNDHDELDRIINLAASSDSPFSIGLRISSSLPRGGISRFGFSVHNTEASGAVEKIHRSPQLRLVGLHVHLYSDTDDPEFYGQAAHSVGLFAARFLRNYQRTLRFVDVGGGFPAHNPKPKSRQSWNPCDIDVYIGHITNSLQKFFPPEELRPTLIVEPGRYLTCDGILLVSRVIHVKERDGRQVVNCDGSISMVPLTHYCPQIIHPYTRQLRRRESDAIDTVIYGATCRENDVLYEGPFARSECGDYLIHFATGAYNSSLSPTFIFPAPEMEFI